MSVIFCIVAMVEVKKQVVGNGEKAFLSVASSQAREAAGERHRPDYLHRESKRPLTTELYNKLC
jgi:hypothetical protein